MKGDFSRGVAADPNVSRVLMQQGRVQLDADWNEAATAAEQRVRAALADLLGRAEPFGVAAVPSANGGFEIVERGGLQFNGTSDYVDVPNAPSLHHRREFAIEGWIDPAPGGRGGTIVARYDGTGADQAAGEFSFGVDAHGRLVFTRVLEETNPSALWHTLRRGNGSWQSSFGSVESQESNDPGPFTAVGCAGVSDELHLVALGPAGDLWHTVRHADGTWQRAFGLVEGQESNDPGAFTAVACGGVKDKLHVVAVGPSGQLWHTVRHADGRWQRAFGLIESQESNDPGAFSAVSCAGVNDELQVVGVGPGGALWHTIRHADGTWQSAFGLVESRESNDPGAFTAVGCAGVSHELHVVAVGPGGQLWHTVRHAGGSWQSAFGLVENRESNDPGAFSAVGCAGVGDELQLVALGPGGRLWHTIRFPDDTWQSAFGLVESQESNDPGAFTAVGCAGVSFELQLVGVAPGVSAQKPTLATLVSTVALPFGEYTHVAAIYDGRWLTLHVGGVPAGTLRLQRGNADRAVPFLVGARLEHGGPASFFDGIIDGLTVWVCGHRSHRRHHRRARPAGAHDCGGPAYRLPTDSPGAGHAPTPVPRALFVTAGRAYVGGIACEQTSDEKLTLPTGSSAAAEQRYLAYLETWERLVTAPEDPSLLDPALGGVDTSAVVRTEARVRVVSASAARRRFGDGDDRGRAAFSLRQDATVENNQLLRVEVHQAGYADGEVAGGAVVRATPGANGALALDPDPGLVLGQRVRLLQRGNAPPLPATVSAAGGGTYTFDPPAPAGTAALVPVAAVKWSRDNGSVAFSAAYDAPSATFMFDDAAGRGSALAVGDFLEIAPGASTGTGAFYTIAAIDTDTPGMTSVAVTLVPGETPLVLDDKARFVLRKWDPFDSDPRDVPLAGTSPQARPYAFVQSGAPIRLGTSGATVDVSFTSGSYRTGDYWWVPTRADGDQLWGWPVGDDGAPLALAPAGIERRYAPLALIVTRGGGRARIRDLRAVFEPLTGGGAGYASDWDAADEQHARGGDVRRPLERDDDEARRASHNVAGENDRDERRAPDRGDDERRRRHDEGEEVVEEDGGFEVRRERHHHGRDHHDRRELPHGALVLTRHEESPHGYRYDGSFVLERRVRPEWRKHHAFAPGAVSGPAVAAALGRCVYVYVEATGDFWRYDTALEGEAAWEHCAAPAAAVRRGAALVALNGRLYLLGGYDESGNPSARCEQFEPVTGTPGVWSACPPMRHARAEFAASAFDGRIVVMGGVRRVPWFGWRFATRTVESYAPDDFRWHRHRSLPERRAGCAGVTVGRRLVLVGGMTGRFWARPGAGSRRVDILALHEGEWQPRAPLISAHRNARLALVDDDLFVVGGTTAPDPAAESERYPLGGEGGTEFPSPPREKAGLVALGGELYALAGEGRSGSPNAVERCRISAPLFVHRREHRDDERPVSDEPAE